MKIMKRSITIAIVLAVMILPAIAQKIPTGNPADFKVKTCLHSIGYSGLWRGQALLSVDQFLEKAKELGYDGVILMAKRPHLSLVDYDKDARVKLRKKMEDLGLTLVGLAGYSDFTAGIDKPGIPHTEIQSAYIGQLAELASDLGTDMIRIFTGYERPGIPYDRQYAMVVEGITLAAREAAKYGVTLVVSEPPRYCPSPRCHALDARRNQSAQCKSRLGCLVAHA
jgi:sugar phosphate isomerase/epimerase